MESKIFDLLSNKNLQEFRVTFSDVELEYAYPEARNLIVHKIGHTIADKMVSELSSLVIKSRDQYDFSCKYMTEYKATFAVLSRNEWTQLVDAATDMAYEIKSLNRRIKLLENELKTIEATAKIALAK